MRAGGGGREDGFTALEVIVTGLLLAVGVIASAQLFVVASTQGRLSKQASDASALAAETVERYRDTSFASIVGGTFVTTSLVGSDRYTVTATITVGSAARAPGPNLDRIHVTVTWNGGTQRYDTETIFSGLQ